MLSHQYLPVNHRLNVVTMREHSYLMGSYPMGSYHMGKLHYIRVRKQLLHNGHLYHYHRRIFDSRDFRGDFSSYVCMYRFIITTTTYKR